VSVRPLAVRARSGFTDAAGKLRGAPALVLEPPREQRIVHRHHVGLLPGAAAAALPGSTVGQACRIVNRFSNV
jgi:hypothetical protein